MNNTRKKYEFTGKTKEIDVMRFNRIETITLHQIRAIRDFGNIMKGDVGGWVEDESNLSHDGYCWVHDDAKVYGKARVYENAQVYDNATVRGAARVYGSALVTEYAMVCGKGKLWRCDAVGSSVSVGNRGLIPLIYG